ncbi:MAG: DinB family protein [Alphaproteobacteria bacterium]|nr:DinB family protein [Alphaproteobacteria bacterium]
MQRLGARSLPVVSRGDKFLIAQSLGKLAEFLGLNETIKPKLSPDELAARIDTINRAAQRFIGQIPVERFEDKLRNRDRPYRVLCHHVFRIPEAIVDALSAGVAVRHESLVQPPPEGMTTPAQVVAYGEQVRQKVAAWWQALPDHSGTKIVETYYGPQPMHEVMERATWHTGQHVRQLMMLLDGLGIEPNQRMTAADFEGLPMPEKVWDE